MVFMHAAPALRALTAAKLAQVFATADAGKISHNGGGSGSA